MKSYLLLGLALLSVHLSFAQQRNTAEVFIQIQDRGSFTVYLDNEFIGTTTGKFRFYDVAQAAPVLSILKGNQKIFSSKLDVRSNERLILGFSARQGLRTLKTLTIYRNGQYALNDFDDYVGAYNTGIVPPPTLPAGNNSFARLLTMVKKETWDDDKANLVQAYTVNSRLSTNEVEQLLRAFDNDDKKLSLAKSLTPVISDLSNYYTLSSAFTFNTAKEEFLSFLNNSKPGKSRGGMRNSTYELLLASVKRTPFDDDKTKLIQAAVQNSQISTAQMTELLRSYSFEDKTLVCAKMAYNFVSDQQSYFALSEIFKFPRTKDTFLTFLSGK
jgi:hypothetical protein